MVCHEEVPVRAARAVPTVLAVTLLLTALGVAPATAGRPCVVTFHGETVEGTISSPPLPGMTVDVVGTYDDADLGVVATTTSDAGGGFAFAFPCVAASAVVRVTDPTGYYPVTYGTASSDVEHAEGMWLGEGVDLGARSVRLTPPGRFVPVEPTRVIDTRDDAEGPLGPGERARFLLDDLPDDVNAVVLNLTATRGTAPTSFVSALWYEHAEPDTSVLNPSAGRDVANLVTLPVSRYSESGQYEVILYNNAGFTHVVADLAGFYSMVEGAGFEPVSPQRVLDTRSTTPLGPRTTRDLVLDGPGGHAPPGAVAVAVTITSTRATARTSYVSAYPSDALHGTSTSVLNAYRGDDVPNLAVVPLGADGAITLYNDQGTTHLVVDVVGWFVETGGADYYPIIARRADGSGPAGPGSTLRFSVQDVGATVRDDAVAMALTLTTTRARTPSFLTVHPTGQARPWASNANARPGADVATGVLTALGPGFSVYNDRGPLVALVDVSGYFAVNGPAGD